MPNIKTFNSKEDIQQQACEWISRIDRGLTVDEHKALQQWTTSSESHRQILFDMAETWDDLSVLNELKGLMPIERIDPSSTPQNPYKGLWPMAAGIAFLLISVMSWFVLNPHLDNSKNQLITKLTTSVGEQKPVTLDDDSVVYLNTNSEIQVNYSDHSRQIKMIKGEALFEVAHDVNRPFIVAAANNTVTAVGTAFNVQLVDDKHFELLVTEGKVLLKNAQQADDEQSNKTKPLEASGTLLIAGQKALVDQSSANQVDLSLQQMQNELAWRQGIVVFQGESLVDALAEISRYIPVKFKLADDEVKHKRVAGYFKAGDIDGLLSALKNNFNIMYQKLDEQTILLSTGG